MIDQSHNIEPKIEAMIQSVVNVQTAYAKALLVDRIALREAQEAGDVLGAYRILQEAYETDVRLWLSEFLLARGAIPTPSRISVPVGMPNVWRTSGSLMWTAVGIRKRRGRNLRGWKRTRYRLHWRNWWYVR